MFKKLYDKKPEEFKTFLTGVGYTLLSNNRYQFVKPEEVTDEVKFQGNIEVLENLSRLFDEESTKWLALIINLINVEVLQSL